MVLFKKEEFEARVRKVKEVMYHRGIETLLVTDPANMNYLTGYDGWSFYVHQGVLVIVNREEPIWFGRQQDSNGARLTTWLSADNIRGYPDDFVQSTLKHPMQFVVEIMRAMGCEKQNLGVEMDNYYFTGQCLDSLSNNLPQADIKDANSLVNWVRAIKSGQEIE